MRPRNREFNIINMSFLDVICGAMRAFLIIMVILIFIFGANRLSGIGKGVGQAIRGFKDEMKTDDKAENAESRSSE